MKVLLAILSVLLCVLLAGCGDAKSIGIIGGADGPTAIFLSSRLAPHQMGAIAVSAYSYMALVPLIQPPIMRALTTKKERYQQLRLDPHFNALQVKYAYAVTCHKAQGGQWGCIYLDQGYLPPDTSLIDYYRWLYTAFTRATEQVYLVNWPKSKEE